MDGADYALKDLEVHTTAAINRIRTQAKKPLNYKHCRFCGDEIDEGGFCDTTCQRKFELKQRG